VGNAGLGSTQQILVNQNARLVAGDPVIGPPPFIAPPITYLQNNANANSFGTIFAIDPKVEIPMVEQYSVGVQREFFGNLALEVRYVGSRSKNLVRGVDLNQIDIFNNGFLGDFNRARSNYLLSVAANPNNTALQTPFCAGITVGCVPLQIFQN